MKSAILVWSLAGAGLLGIALNDLYVGQELRPYLIPWCFLLGLITLLPGVVLVFRGRFDLFHPLVYAAWSYFFPGFAIGGLMLALGISQAYYIAYVQDEVYTFQLTFFYVILGFTSLIAGFVMPPGRKLGNFIRDRLPEWDLQDSEARTGGLFLYGVGICSILFAFSFGVFGYQRPEEGSDFAGIIFSFTMFWSQASFLLALTVFRSSNLTPQSYLILGLLVLGAIGNAMLAGSRGGFFHFLVPLLFAFVYSGRKISSRHYVILGTIGVVAIVVGVIYGTTFRSLRHNYEAVSLDRYVSAVPNTLETIVDKDPVRVFEEGVSTLANRIELVSSLAVVVSNYEALAPFEEQLGISNNILVDTSTFFIPRVIWSEKPVSIEPAKYAELYFNYNESAFSMTPIGDLLRNFGPWGIPIGMMILGMILRTIYQALVAGQPFSYWKLTMYYLIVTSVSYDGTFGLILPTIFKWAFIGLVGLGIVILINFRLRSPK